jgi:hypothetical protein
MVGALLGDRLALGQVAAMATKDPIDKALAKAAKLIEERKIAGEATAEDHAASKHIKAAAAWRRRGASDAESEAKGKRSQ